MTPPLHPAFRSHDYIATAMKLRAAIASTLGQAAAERANQTLIRESSKWFHISADEHEAFKEQLDELIAEILADAAAGIDRSSLTFKVHARLDEAAERIGNFQPSPLEQHEVKTFSDAAPRPEWPYRTSFSEDRSVACIKLDGKVLTVDGDFVGDLKALWPWELRKGGTVKKWVPRLARKTLKVTGGVWRPLSHFVLIKKYGNVTQRQMRNAVRFRNGDPLDLRSDNVYLTFMESGSKNVIAENRRLHPLPTDRNDLKQDKNLEVWEKDGTVASDAEISKEQLADPRLIKVYGVAGRVSSGLLEEVTTIDDVHARATPVVDVDKLEDGEVHRGKPDLTPFRAWNGRVQRLYCKTHEALQKVVAKNDIGTTRLECGCERKEETL